MKRRTFLKLTAATLGAAALPPAFGATTPHRGPFLVTVYAGGGWDPTFLCDPTPSLEVNRVTAEIASIGALRYAPWTLETIPNLPFGVRPYLMSNEAFFTKYAPHLTVFNGIDTSTINHDAGARALWRATNNPSQGAVNATPLGQAPPPSDLPSDLAQMLRQAQSAINALSSGLAASARVTLRGFDTHASHDRNQRLQLAKLLYGIDFLWREAGRAGLQHKLTIAVGSDFGRGPHYNGPHPDDGKDHWPVTSMMFMGAAIPGGRVIGATDQARNPLRLDPSTLRAGLTGVALTPDTIQRALRRTLSAEPLPSALTQGHDLPLFG